MDVGVRMRHLRLVLRFQRYRTPSYLKEIYQLSWGRFEETWLGISLETTTRRVVDLNFVAI